MPNEFHNLENPWRTSSSVGKGLRAEFDALDPESERERRILSLSAHDGVAGRASRKHVIEDSCYSQRRMRKDEIARFALSSPMTAPEGELP